MCEKCNGRLFRHQDDYGEYLGCSRCGRHTILVAREGIGPSGGSTTTGKSSRRVSFEDAGNDNIMKVIENG